MFYVKWQTAKGPGVTFYHGVEQVPEEDGIDAEQAAYVAQVNVWRRAFPEWSRAHIIITGVSTTPPRSANEDES